MNRFKLKPAYAARRMREALTDFKNDNFVITYPRSGRNWSRNMLTDCGVPNFKEKVFDINTLAQELSSRKKIIFGHDVADYPFIQDLRSCNPEKYFKPKRYNGKNIFLVIRNPIDIAISHFHWMNYNRDQGEDVGSFPEDINEFVLSEEFGVRKIAAFHNLWINFLENGDEVNKYQIYAYEDMRENAALYLKNMLAFFEFNISDDIIESAVEKNSAAKAKADKERQTKAGKKLSIHGTEKVSEETLKHLLEIIGKDSRRSQKVA